MNTLIAIIILLILIAYGHKEYMQAQLGCSPRNSSRKIALTVAQFLRNQKQPYNILDLGSGWGNTI
jgi:uncharacterized membrane protein YczE